LNPSVFKTGTISLLTNVMAFLFVLGVLIFVHELGHFLMARRIGVRVLTFSLGFGPKLISFKRGDTEYCISAVPLGGYVKMAGENPDDARTGAPDEFLSKGKWQRFQVLVMGPIMNLVLAVVVMAVVLYQGAQVAAFEQQAVVIGAFSDTSVAAKAGLKLGDRIVTVDGKPTDTWDQFAMAIVPKAKREVNLGFVRDGRAGQVTVVPWGQGKYEFGDIGGIGIHVVANERLGGTAVAAPVVGDDPVSLRQEEHHLVVPVVGAERPAVVEDDRLAGAPILVVNFGAVFGFDGRHDRTPLWMPSFRGRR